MKDSANQKSMAAAALPDPLLGPSQRQSGAERWRRTAFLVGNAMLLVAVAAVVLKGGASTRALAEKVPLYPHPEAFLLHPVNSTPMLPPVANWKTPLHDGIARKVSPKQGRHRGRALGDACDFTPPRLCDRHHRPLLHPPAPLQRCEGVRVRL